MGEVDLVMTEDGKTIAKEMPLAGIRKIIAARMSESLKKSPQATMSAKTDMSALKALKESYANNGVKLTYTDLLVKATAEALKLNPTINSSLQDGKIVQYESINIGVAVGTDKALFVPVIKNVQKKSVVEVSKELRRLIQKANEGKLLPEDFSGGTFTISNLGMFNLDVMTPIVNIPEAAILCIGATRKELVVEDDDTIKIKPMTTLSLTIDHAVLDGLPSAKFMESLCSVIQNPSQYNIKK